MLPLSSLRFSAPVRNRTSPLVRISRGAGEAGELIAIAREFHRKAIILQRVLAAVRDVGSRFGAVCCFFAAVLRGASLSNCTTTAWRSAYPNNLEFQLGVPQATAGGFER
jgi:hypothetical protein